MKKISLLLLSIGLVLSSCKDDENQPEQSTANQADNTSGVISATYEEGDFWTDNVTARFRSNEIGFIITAEEEDFSSFYFIFYEFEGNGEFSVSPESNIVAFFSPKEDGESVFYQNGTGTVEIEGYDPSEGTLKISFSLNFTKLSDNSIISLVGSSTTLEIVELPEPEPGQMNLFDVGGAYYNEHSPTASINHLGILDIDFDIMSGLDCRIQVYTNDVESPESVRIGNSSWRDLELDDIISWNFDGENNLVSAHLKDYNQGDFEIWFVDIPFTQVVPFDLENGDIVFVNGQDTIHFETAFFEVEFSDAQHSTFEAISTQGEKLRFQTTLPIPCGPQYCNPFLSIATTLEYYLDQNNLYPSLFSQGLYTTFKTSDEPSLGDVNFQSYDEQIILKAKGIDFL
ncbi:MAG: hypothetical protein AAGC47_01535 [Bacteroidota bacterium]